MFFQTHDSQKTFDKYPLTVYFLGYHHHQEPIVQNPGIDIYQLFYCEKGSGIVTTNNHSFEVHEHELFLLSPDTFNEYFSPNRDWIVDIIGFSGFAANQIVNHLELDKAGVYRLSAHFPIIRLIQEMTKNMNDQDAQRKLSTACYQILISMIDTLAPVIAVPDATDLVSSKVIPYLADHFTEAVSLDDVAQYCGVSSGDLTQIFRHKLHRTMNSYINGLRINKARKELILHPEYNIAEIAHHCGYNSVSYFGVVFKKRMNKSPLQYRLNHLPKDY